MKAAEVSAIADRFLKSRFDDPKPTPAFHQELWQLACCEHPKVAIAAPRGHAKSTAITHCFTITAVGLRYHKYVMIISDTEDQASEFLNDIRLEFEENDELIQFLGVRKITKATQTDLRVAFHDGEEFRIIARGAEQKVRGRKWRGVRPDLVICDDIENDELVSSDDRRNKLRRWFYGAVLPAGSDRCRYRFIGTILHFDSLLANLMPTEDEAEVFPLANYGDPDAPWLAVAFRAHTDEGSFDDILWPEKWPKERLERERNDYIRQGLPEVYSQEFLNHPISMENAIFRMEDLYPMSPDDFQKRRVFYLGADLAISEKSQRAYTVIYACSWDGETLMVEDRVKGRWPADRIVDEIFYMVEKFDNKDHDMDRFFIESENIAKAIGPWIYEAMRERNRYFTLQEVTPSKDKMKRSSVLQAMVRAGAVKFNTESGWWLDAKSQILQFPMGAYKDDVDALSHIAAGIRLFAAPATDQEVADEEYEMEFFWNDVSSEQGRNRVTGY